MMSVSPRTRLHIVWIAPEERSAPAAHALTTAIAHLEPAVMAATTDHPVGFARQTPILNTVVAALAVETTFESAIVTGSAPVQAPCATVLWAHGKSGLCPTIAALVRCAIRRRSLASIRAAVTTVGATPARIIVTVRQGGSASIGPHTRTYDGARRRAKQTPTARLEPPVTQIWVARRTLGTKRVI